MDQLQNSKKLLLQSPRKEPNGTVVMPKLFDLGTNHSSRPKVSSETVRWDIVSILGPVGEIGDIDI
jgi:hypothetical protein